VAQYSLDTAQIPRMKEIHFRSTRGKDIRVDKLTVEVNRQPLQDYNHATYTYPRPAQAFY
jgi:hypothetical protein